MANDVRYQFFYLNDCYRQGYGFRGYGNVKNKEQYLKVLCFVHPVYHMKIT